MQTGKMRSNDMSQSFMDRCLLTRRQLMHSFAGLALASVPLPFAGLQVEAKPAAPKKIGILGVGRYTGAVLEEMHSKKLEGILFAHVDSYPWSHDNYVDSFFRLDLGGHDIEGVRAAHFQTEIPKHKDALLAFLAQIDRLFCIVAPAHRNPVSIGALPEIARMAKDAGVRLSIYAMCYGGDGIEYLETSRRTRWSAFYENLWQLSDLLVLNYVKHSYYKCQIIGIHESGPTARHISISFAPPTRIYHSPKLVSLNLHPGCASGRLARLDVDKHALESKQSHFYISLDKFSTTADFLASSAQARQERSSTIANRVTTLAKLRATVDPNSSDQLWILERAIDDYGEDAQAVWMKAPPSALVGSDCWRAANEAWPGINNNYQFFYCVERQHIPDSLSSFLILPADARHKRGGAL